ncbi:MAG TPA: hypothetical protein VFR18_14885, partial [Terriglobia bacterium]|nr:hypothetical protein [Terriglobia bacterium]
VVVEGGFSNLDDYGYVGRDRMPELVKVAAHLYAGDVRQRFVVQIKTHRQLRPNERSRAQQDAQAATDAAHRVCMTGARRQPNNLTVHELSPLTILEETNPSHPVILVHAKTPSVSRRHHASPTKRILRAMVHARIAAFVRH